MVPEKTRSRSRSRSGYYAGIGVDYAGGPVVDPTENVKALSEALSQRQDDLRDLNNKYLDARLDSMEKNAIKDASHAKEIRELESKRVDAVREIDVVARNTAAAQALTAIQTLAATTGAEREALRSLVSTTAATIQNQTDRIVGAITDRIAILEKTSYTGQGKQALFDPQVAELIQDLKNLRGTKQEGLSEAMKFLIGIGTLFALAITIGTFVFITQRGGGPAVPTPAPQILYVPAPPGTLLPSPPSTEVPR